MLLSQSNPPLRQRRQRTNFNDEALSSLEEAFAKNPYPDINEREQMARELKTTEDRVQVWFQNKRARYRKKMQKENGAKKSSKRGVESDNEETNMESPRMNCLREQNNQASTPVVATTIESFKSKLLNESIINKSSDSFLNDSGYLTHRSTLDTSSASSPMFANYPMLLNPYHQAIYSFYNQLSTPKSFTQFHEATKQLVANRLFRPYV